jgi:hypothetical protein
LSDLEFVPNASANYFFHSDSLINSRCDYIENKPSLIEGAQNTEGLTVIIDVFQVFTTDAFYLEIVQKRARLN